MEQLLAIGPEERLKKLPGMKTLEPAFGMPGVWLSREKRKDAESLGCLIYTPMSVITTCLVRAARHYAADIFDIGELQKLIGCQRESHPEMLRIIFSKGLKLRELHRVLQNLLGEQVSIRDMVVILEAFIENQHLLPNIDLVTGAVRKSLSRNICRVHGNYLKEIRAITLGQSLRDLLIESALKTGECITLDLDAQIQEMIAESFGRAVSGFQKKGLKPVVIAPDIARAPLARLLTRRFHGEIAVLSEEEIAWEWRVVSVHRMRMMSVVARRLLQKSFPSIVRDKTGGEDPAPGKASGRLAGILGELLFGSEETGTGKGIRKNQVIERVRAGSP